MVNVGDFSGAEIRKVSILGEHHIEQRLTGVYNFRLGSIGQQKAI